MSGERFELGFVPRAYLVLCLSGLLFLAPVYFTLVALARLLRWEIVWLERPDIGLVLTSPFLLLAIAVPGVACLLLWLRQPGGARVTWDKDGVTEWDGAGVRVAIPWTAARRTVVEVVRRSNRGVRPEGAVHQLSDGDGRRITITNSPGPLNWMLRRRMYTAAGSLYFFGQERPGGFPGGGELRPDDPRRSGSLLVWFTRLGYAGVIAAAILARGASFSSYGGSDLRMAALLFAASGAVLALRALRPLGELLRLRREDRRFRGSRHMTIEGNDGTVVSARGDDGLAYRFDVGPLKHPDALLHLRRSGVRVVPSRRVPAGPGDLLPVEAVEHDGTAEARRRLVLAVAAEVAARLLIAILPAIAARLAWPS